MGHTSRAGTRGQAAGQEVCLLPNLIAAVEVQERLTEGHRDVGAHH
jgi:hypothetical protein